MTVVKNIMTIKETLETNLSRGSIPTAVKTNTRSDLLQGIANPDLLVANMICARLGIRDSKYIIRLGRFIEESWLDLEICDKQIDNILEEIKKIHQEYITKDKMIY